MLKLIELAPGWQNLKEIYGEEGSSDLYYNRETDTLSFFPVFERKNLKHAVEIFEDSLLNGEKLNLLYLIKVGDLKKNAIDLCKRNMTWREALDPNLFKTIFSEILEIRGHDKVDYSGKLSAEQSGIAKERYFFRGVKNY